MINIFRLYLIQVLGICSTITVVATYSHAGQTIYQLQGNVFTNKKSQYSHLAVEKKHYFPDSNIHSYKNWGNSEAAVLPSYSRNKNAFDAIIKEASAKHGVAEGLIKAVMHTESGFNVSARSPVGAQGLMQLMPATARRFNVSNVYDPYQNIMAGAKYLAWLLKRFNGNTSLALAGYNAGEGNVAKYGGIPPFRETQDYVRRVTSRYNNLYSGSLSISSPTLSASNTTSTPNAEIKVLDTPKTSTNTKLESAKKVVRDIVQRSDGTFAYANSPTHSSHGISISE